MKAGGGSRKGSAFEREVCVQLSLWWTQGSRDDVFWRTAGSGARAKMRSKVGKKTLQHYSDIKADDSVGELLTRLCCFELKTGYGHWSPLDFVDAAHHPESSPMGGFLSRLCADTETSGRPFPILIFRRQGRKACICLPLRLYNAIARVFQYHNGSILFFHTGFFPVKRWVTMELETFLSHCTAEDIREVAPCYLPSRRTR